MSTDAIHKCSDPFSLSQKKVWHILEEISREAVASTFEQAYVDAIRLQVDPTGKGLISDISAVDKSAGIQGRLDARSPSAASVDRLSVDGEQAATIDVIVHHLVRERIFRLLGGFIKAVGGEEATAGQWREFLQLRQGELGAIIDPVDGTSNARTIREGFSCNIALFRSRGDGTFELLGAVCTNNSQETLAFNLNPESAHMMSPRGTVVDLTGAAFDPTRRRPGTLATVATRGPAREEISGILDPQGSFDLPSTEYGGKTVHDPALTVFVTAGAPKMISWPLSGLDYLYVPHDQAVYDAIPMGGVLLAGNCSYYIASTGQRATFEEVIGWLSDVRSPGEDPYHHRTFKAGLLVRDGANISTTKKILEKIKIPVR